VKLRIFPREESYFDLFDEVAANLVDAAQKLLDMVEDFVDPEMKAKRLVEAEHEGDRLTHAIYSRLTCWSSTRCWSRWTRSWSRPG
jgi:uncharacterized protein Yka (UPF0111/DUF47 family)